MSLATAKPMLEFGIESAARNAAFAAFMKFHRRCS